ncbi:MAG: phosphoribosylamine--glycine ligase [Gaiellales bacterium]
MRVLLIGSGGREHSLAWKLAQSPRLTELHAAPGNPGIAQHATLHDVPTSDLEGLTALAVRLHCDLVVVGPEAPLVDGLTDRLEEAGIAVFGPSAAAARLEGSKAFAKSVMEAVGVPTGRFAVCDTPAAAQAAIAEAGGSVVIKADGLAAGKGVFVCSSAAEAEQAVRTCLVDRRFGESGARVLVEELMQGPEVSVLALCDGEHVRVLPTARDAKRALDGDRGPNTGGMGCVSPAPGMAPDTAAAIVAAVHQPVVNELARRGTPFRGCLYAGLMLTDAGPRVLEFNVRFGDPEAQAVLPRLHGDLLELLDLAARGSLESAEAGAGDDVAVSVVVAAEGYPDAPVAGAAIDGIHAAEAIDGVTVFHAGTALEAGRLVASGGRVLNVTAVANDLASARERAYGAVSRIAMNGAHHRSDIGLVSADREHLHV